MPGAHPLDPYAGAPGHGWPATPWLPFPPESADRSVEAQREDPGSVLHLYRRMLAARRASPALHRGDLTLLDAPPDLVAYRRHAGDDERVVVVNMGSEPAAWPVNGEVVEVASDGSGEGRPFGGVVAPDTAVVLR